ncbi:BTAD domain-containing putative transcriptional regulator [Streptomyces sp. NPDC101112]|uniref:AfsR/SARP family transcriptional regulator n=1 Tax=Streptomyces sp. NPDC101112 TaxID=3366105 RepID=UPI0037F90F7E
MFHQRPRFHLLGPFEVEIGQRAIALTGRQRALCATLLLHANHVVSVDRVIHFLWGESPPTAGPARVRALVAEVRRAFGPTGADVLITRNPGYLMHAQQEQLDLLAFEALITDGSRSAARQDWAKAHDDHDRALALWRGDPLPDLPTAEAERQRLSELRIAALEGRAEANIALGRHRGAIVELLHLTAMHPLRERPHALLMSALHQEGRTAEALELYAVLRRRLVDELGVEPSEDLRSLHQRLLTGIGPSRETVTVERRPTDSRVPRQLPRAPRRVVGRDRELRRLDDCRRNGEPLALVVGPAGVGKTALALHWAHRVAQHFPDGQLFLDMRGFDDNTEPMTPEEALPLLLQGLGCSPREVPLSVAAQQALYRTLLADRRVLVVLDDVVEADHVRQLLPSSRGSLTLVTSRHMLNALVTLDWAHRVSCEVLDETAALELISNAVGPEAVAADPESVSRLIDLCDRLPLALCVAGSWISARRPDSIKSYVRDLAERGRLARLHVEGEESVAVRAALDLSYGSLPEKARRAFRTLGLMPGTGRSITAAAAAVGMDPAQTADALRLAQRVHLLRDIDSGRMTWHDLVQEYARERVVAEEDPRERTSAVARLLDHYLQTIGNVARTCGLYVSRQHPAAVDGSNPRTFDTAEDAYAWFDSEWDDMAAAIAHAAEHGPAAFAWHIVDGLMDLFHHRRPLSDWVRLAELARAAAERDGDVLGQAAMHLSSGHARWRNGEFRSALGHYERTEALARTAGWLYGEAAGLQGKGVSLKLLGEPRRALSCYARPISLYRLLGEWRGEVVMLINTASLNLVLGQLADAEKAVTEALAVIDGAVDHYHAMALVNLALVRQKQARFDEACAALRKSFVVSRDSGSVYAEAIALETLGRVQSDAGRDERALHAYEDALSVSQRSENRNCQVDSLVGLASVEARRGHVTEARRMLDAAKAIAEETGHRTGLVEVLMERAVVDCAAGDHGDALVHLERAAGLAEEGSPLILPRIRALAASALLEIGETAEALRMARQSADLSRDSGQRLVYARALTALAEIHRAKDDEGSAQAEQILADTLFAEIGTPEQYRCAALWRAARTTLPSAPGRRRRHGEPTADAVRRFNTYLADHFDAFTP